MADMFHKSAPFPWTKARDQAAVLLADNDLSDEAIANEVGVTRRTLANWKLHPAFTERVNEHLTRIQLGMLKLTIAKKHKRLATLDTMHDKLLRVIDERAAEMHDAPGAGTGLVVRRYKIIGTGENAEMVEEYAVDTATLRELRALEEQAAKELGQWVEKSQVEDLTRVVEIVGVDAEAI